MPAADPPSEDPAGSPGRGIPDLGRKLDLLLQRRGGQETRGGRPVRSNGELAAALGVDRSQISRWRATGRIGNPELRVPMLCAIFAIEPTWLDLDFDAFAERCAGRPPVSWSRLAADAARGAAVLRVEYLGPIEPAPIEPGPFAQLYVARPAAAPPPAPRLTVKEGSRIRLDVMAPATPGGGAGWLGWPLVVVSRDATGDLCLLPRYAQAFGVPARMPPTGRLSLELAHHRGGGTGAQALVAVAHRDPLPPFLDDALRADAEGAALTPALDQLAHWARPRLAAGQAGLGRIDYTVVPG